MRTFGDFAKLSSVPEAKGVPAAEDMIRPLVEGHEAVVRIAPDLPDRRRGERRAHR